MADGTAINGRTAICCAGRWTEELAALVGAHIPMLPPIAGGATLGLLLYVGPAPARLTRFVSTPRVNIRPDLPDGWLVFRLRTWIRQSTPTLGTTQPARRPARDILHRAAAALPALENAPVESLASAIGRYPQTGSPSRVRSRTPPDCTSSRPTADTRWRSCWRISCRARLPTAWIRVSLRSSARAASCTEWGERLILHAGSAPFVPQGRDQPSWW